MKLKKMRVIICFAVACVSMYLMQEVCFAADNWTISQTVSQSDCEQGTPLILSVYLGGSEGSLSVSKIKGELEYDTSLFTITGVSAAGMTVADSDYAQGVFTLTAAAERTLKKGDLLFQVQIQVKDDSAIGKTTICVNSVGLEGAGGNTSIVNVVPSSVNILQSENQNNDEGETEEEEEEKDEDEPDDAVSSNDRKKDKKTSTKKTSTKKTSTKKTSGSDTKNSGQNNPGNQSTVKKGTKTPSKVSSAKQLDKNYKTDAGFGNDLYFVIAFIFGALALVGCVIYKKVSGKYIRE